MCVCVCVKMPSYVQVDCLFCMDTGINTSFIFIYLQDDYCFVSFLNVVSDLVCQAAMTHLMLIMQIVDIRLSITQCLLWYTSFIPSYTRPFKDIEAVY